MTALLEVAIASEVRAARAKPRGRVSDGSNSPASITPGRNEARKRSPTETPIWSPRMTSTMLGGIIWPSVPEAQMTPVASLGS